MELSCEPLWLSLTPSLISIQQKSFVLPYTQALGVIFGVFFPLRAALIWARPWGRSTVEWTCLGTPCQVGGSDTASSRRHLVCLKGKRETSSHFPSLSLALRKQLHLTAILPYWLNLGHQSARTSWVKERDYEWAMSNTSFALAWTPGTFARVSHQLWWSQKLG